MNKTQLVDALADRLGDRRTAATAVDALLQIVVDTVRSGGSVSLAGFGVFESRARAARTGRNPRTGETVAVPATTVPAFRPGAGFRSAVAGDDPTAPSPSSVDAADDAADAAVADPSAAAPVNGAAQVEPPDIATTLPDPDPAAGTRTKAARKPKAEKAEKAARTAKAEKKADADADAGKDKKKSKKGKK